MSQRFRVQLWTTIDWDLLREQKLWLLSAKKLTGADEAMICGLVHLIDGLQDEAVKAGMTEDLIFGEPALPFTEETCQETTTS